MKTTNEANAKPATQNTDDLPEQIRKIGKAVDLMLSKGFNRHAVVVLLKDATRMGTKDIETVLNGLTELERRYCKK